MPLPDWIRTRATEPHAVKRLLRTHRLATVCEEARCPNRGVCFAKPTAAFMILGDRCTRACAFCAVAPGAPSSFGPPDPGEPERVAAAAAELGLRYVVVTSVTRDDLPDGGAAQFAATIRAVRRRVDGIKVEVLTPDFNGDLSALAAVLAARPDVFNHNIETVPRLYATVRPQADYGRSLRVLRAAKRLAPEVATKSGLMAGLGESRGELLQAFADLRAAGCEILTVGQYLRPAKKNLPVVEYVAPEIFEELRQRASAMGFSFVAAGPLVRSSMNAEEMYGAGGK